MSKRPIWHLPKEVFDKYGLMSRDELEAHIERLLAEQAPSDHTIQDEDDTLSSDD